jgi:hypothetical protein
MGEIDLNIVSTNAVVVPEGVDAFLIVKKMFSEMYL